MVELFAGYRKVTCASCGAGGLVVEVALCWICEEPLTLVNLAPYGPLCKLCSDCADADHYVYEDPRAARAGARCDWRTSVPRPEPRWRCVDA